MVRAPAHDLATPSPLPQFRVLRGGADHAPVPTPRPDELRAVVERGGPDLLDRIAPEWADLCAEVAAEPFIHPDWLRADLATRAPAEKVVLVTVRGPAGELRAVLPLAAERVRVGGVPLRRWRSLGPARFPERFDLLCRPADRAATADAVWAALRAARGWDLVELAAVPPGAAALTLRDRAAAEGAPVASRPCLSTRVLPLAAPGGAEGARPSLEVALAGASTKLKADLRRARRKLEQLGPVELVRIDSADHPRFESVLSEFLALEAAGWKGRGGTAIASDPATEAFFRRLARLAADRGWLSLYALTVDGRLAAAHLGLTWPRHEAPGAPAGPESPDGPLPRTYAVPKLTYDESLAVHSPGSLIVLEIIHDLVARGVSTFDFLAQDAPWKARWTPHLLPCDRLFLFHPSPRGRLAHALRFRALPAAKRHYVALLASSVLASAGAADHETSSHSPGRGAASEAVAATVAEKPGSKDLHALET